MSGKSLSNKTIVLDGLVEVSSKELSDTEYKYKMTIVEPYDIPMPVIFSDEPPWHTIAYFGGPWLPMANVGRFTKYASEIQNPLNALEIPEKRENIIQGILKLTENPNVLFSNDRDTLNNDLEMLLKLKEKRLYKQWQQKTKTKIRTISTPNPELDNILKKYVKRIIMKEHAHPKARGGELGWSPAKMIKAHMPFNTVLSCDISQAFQSAESNFVFEFYYNLASKYLPENMAGDTAGFLTTLSTVAYYRSGNYALPQGSPISMALFNRMLYPIDENSERICQGNGMQYSRWVDDIIITSQKPHENHYRFTGVLSEIWMSNPMPIHKVFFQNKEPFYILGQEIRGYNIIQSKDDSVKNARQSISESYYRDSFEDAFDPGGYSGQF